MSAEIGKLITASIYNAIRSKVNKVIGTGDGAEFGYGQSLSSILKADNDVITAQDMQNLYDDIFLAAKHQSGDPPTWTIPSDGLNAPDAGEIVGVYAADLGDPDPSTGNRSSINSLNDVNEGFLDFEQAAQQIEDNHFNTGTGALTVKITEESTRTVPWKTSINHTVTIQWPTAAERRYWANAGGKIRINANLTGGTSVPGDVTATPPGTKDEIWQTMLNTMGTVEIGVQGSTSTGTGTVDPDVSIQYSNRSNRTDWSNTSLSNPKQLFVKSGSGVYSENRYIIEAWEVADNALRFNIKFLDFDVGDDQNPGAPGSTPVDENITGIVTSTVSLVTPNGFLDISIPTSTTSSSL